MIQFLLSLLIAIFPQLQAIKTSAGITADHFIQTININVNKQKPVVQQPKRIVYQAKQGSIFFTSYNPVKAQTDNSPCIGASGINQCELAKQGVRMIALSQELVGRTGNKSYTYGDTVELQSSIDDPRCNGTFLVVDTMNARYRNRGDIFFTDRKDNISCYATVKKVTTTGSILPTNSTENGY